MSRQPLWLLAVLGILPACTPPPEARAEEHLREGVSLTRAGQPDAAARELAHAITLVPDHYEALTRLARIRLEQRRFAEARAAALRAGRLRPRSAYVRELLGRSALGLRDLPTMERDLGLAANLDPARRYLWVTIGRAQEQSHRRAQAAYSYAIAAGAFPAAAEPRICRARALLGTVVGYELLEDVSRLLEESRAAKDVTDAQRAEIARLTAHIAGLQDALEREEQRAVDLENARVLAEARARAKHNSPAVFAAVVRRRSP